MKDYLLDLAKQALRFEKPAARVLLDGLAHTGLVQVFRQFYDLIHKERKPNGDAWQVILALLEKDGHVTRRSVMKALNIGEKQAEYLSCAVIASGNFAPNVETSRGRIPTRLR